MLAAFLLLPLLNLHAQQNNLKIEWGPMEKVFKGNLAVNPYADPVRRIELLGAGPYGYYMFRNTSVFTTEGKCFLMRYNYAHQLSGQFELKINEGNFLLCTKLIRDKLLIITYNFKDGPNEGTVYAQTYSNMGKPLEQKQIARFYTGHLRFMHNLQVSISPDSNSFAIGGISFDKNKTAHTVSYYLYDLNLKELFSTKGTINFHKEKKAPEIESLLLDSRGNIFSVVQLYPIFGLGSDGPDRISSDAYLVKASLRAPEMQFTHMMVAGNQIRTVSVLDDSVRGRLICAGVYESELTLTKWANKKQLGVYYIAYNKENGDIVSRKNFDIPPNELTTSKWVKRKEQDHLYFREIYQSVAANGFITIVAEQTGAVFNDLLCWSMNKDGDLVWISCVPKFFSGHDKHVSFSTRQFASCLTFENETTLYIIYRKRNEKPTEEEMSHLKFGSRLRKTRTALCVMDKKTGRFTMEPWPPKEKGDRSTFDGEQYISLGPYKKIVHSQTALKQKTGILFIPQR
jgi:hypothetical protein